MTMDEVNGWNFLWREKIEIVHSSRLYIIEVGMRRSQKKVYCNMNCHLFMVTTVLWPEVRDKRLRMHEIKAKEIK